MASVCPKCGFAGAAVLRDGTLRCGKCGNTWQERLGYPQPPSGAIAQAAIAANPSVRLAILMVVAVMLVMGASVAVFMISATEQPSPDKPPPPAIAPAVQPKLSATLDDVVGHGQVGNLGWWVVHYKNTSNVAISYPKVHAVLTGPEEGWKREVDGKGIARSLEPGESTWVFITCSGTEQDTRASLTPAALRLKSKYFAGSVRLRVFGVKFEQHDEFGRTYPYIRGQVRNDSHKSVYSLQVYTIGRGADDVPCLYATSNLQFAHLKPGETTEFTYRLGPYKTAEPRKWTTYAVGHVGN